MEQEPKTQNNPTEVARKFMKDDPEQGYNQLAEYARSKNISIVEIPAANKGNSASFQKNPETKQLEITIHTQGMSDQKKLWSMHHELIYLEATVDASKKFFGGDDHLAKKLPDLYQADKELLDIIAEDQNRVASNNETMWLLSRRDQFNDGTFNENARKDPRMIKSNKEYAKNTLLKKLK